MIEDRKYHRQGASAGEFEVKSCGNAHAWCRICQPNHPQELKRLAKLEEERIFKENNPLKSCRNCGKCDDCLGIETPEGTRRCTECNEFKTFSEFTERVERPGKYKSKCKKCPHCQNLCTLHACKGDPNKWGHLSGVEIPHATPPAESTQCNAFIRAKFAAPKPTTANARQRRAEWDNSMPGVVMPGFDALTT